MTIPADVIAFLRTNVLFLLRRIHRAEAGIEPYSAGAADNRHARVDPGIFLRTRYVPGMQSAATGHKKQPVYEGQQSMINNRPVHLLIRQPTSSSR
jgi:hypothetical protein